jgi:tetratricopeptide (TPR) repeat protein
MPRIFAGCQFFREVECRVALAAWLWVLPATSAADGPDPRALFAEGQEAYAAGDFPKAFDRFLCAYRVSRSPELAYNVARVAERMGESAGALRYYRLYLQADPPPAEADRAPVLRKIAELRARIESEARAGTPRPPTEEELRAEAQHWFERGLVVYRRGEFEAALQAFTEAYRFARLPDIVFNLARTCERLDRTRDAIDYYREYLRRRPDAPDRRDVEAAIRGLEAP